MTTKTKAFETKDALDLYKKIIYTEGKAGRRMDKKQIEEMIDLAIKQLGYSYAPYSHFHVGAALLAKNGTYYTGCNIENAAYTPTNCAERTAFFKAVSEGVKEFQAICVVGGRDGVLTGYAAPCGVCRQVMAEFCEPDTFRIFASKKNGEYREYTLGELFPGAFTKDDIEKARVY